MSLRVASGEYTGDGNASQNISVGFQPKVVLVFRAVAGNEAFIRIDTMAANTSTGVRAEQGSSTTAITGEGATSFTVGSALNVNAASYCYIAIGGTECVTGSYTGDGSGTQIHDEDTYNFEYVGLTNTSTSRDLLQRFRYESNSDNSSVRTLDGNGTGSGGVEAGFDRNLITGHEVDNSGEEYHYFGLWGPNVGHAKYEGNAGALSVTAKNRGRGNVQPEALIVKAEQTSGSDTVLGGASWSTFQAYGLNDLTDASGTFSSYDASGFSLNGSDQDLNKSGAWYWYVALQDDSVDISDVDLSAGAGSYDGEVTIPCWDRPDGLSLNAKTTRYETRTRIDSGNWDGAVFYFEVVLTNNSGGVTDLDLVDCYGRIKASINGIANGASGVYRSGSFNLTEGNCFYELWTETGMTGFASDLYEVRIVAVLSGSSKAEFPVSLILGDDVGSTSYGQTDADDFAQFVKNEAKYGDTIDGWRLEAVAKGTWINSGVTAGIKLVNKTDSVDVVGAEILEKRGRSNGNWFFDWEVEFSNGATNFDDGDTFWLQTKDSDSNLIVYHARIWVQVSNLSKARIFHRIASKSTGSSDGATDEKQRYAYAGTAYDQVDAAYLQVTAREGASDARTVGLRDVDAGADRGSGINPDDTSLKRHLSSELLSSLVADNKLGLVYRSGSQQVFVAQANLVLDTTGVSDVDIVSTFSDSPVVFSDQLLGELAGFSSPLPASSLQVLQAALSVTMYENAIVATISDSPMVFTDSIGQEALADLLRTSPVESLQVLQDALAVGFADQWDKRGMLPLVTITPANGSDVIYLAPDGVRHPSRFFQGRIRGFGEFSRSIPVPSGLVQIGDGRVDVLDPDGSIRAAVAPKTIRKSTAEIRIGPEGGSYSAFLRAIRREVGDVDFPEDGVTSFNVRDFVFDFLEEDVPALIDPEHFPNLPQNPQRDFANIVLGEVSSVGIGAIPCPLVDTTTNAYLFSRHLSLSVDEVYRKRSGEENFTLVDSSEYSIDYTYALFGAFATLIQFDTDQGEDTEICANGKGYHEDGVLALTDFSDVILAIFQTFVGVEYSSDRINFQSFADTKTRLASLGWECAGAWTEKITYREALTQILRSSNVDLFTDKEDRITVHLTTGDDTASPVLDDVLRLFRGSVRQELADPTFNRIPYRYSKNYTLNKWDFEEDFDNSVDQEALGEVVPEEPLQMYFIRDSSTAEGVVGMRSSWLDLDAFRFEAEVPLVPTVEKLELAQLVKISHFGGIASGGYSEEVFKITSLGMDLNRLRYRVKGIRYVAPPEAVESEIEGDYDLNAKVGPYRRGNTSQFFGVFKEVSSGDQTVLKVWYSGDWGASWELADSLSLANNIASFDVAKGPNEKLHIVTMEESTHRIGYHIFDTSSRAFTTENEEVLSTVAVASTASVPFVSIDVDSSAFPHLFHSWTAETVASVEYQKNAYSWKDGSGWHIGHQVSASGARDFDKAGRILIVGDYAHFFYTNLYRYGVEVHNRAPLGSSSFAGENEWVAHNIVSYPTSANYGQGAVVEDESGNKYGIIGWRASFGRAYLALVQEAGTVHSWKSFGYFTNWNLGDGGEYPSIAISVTPEDGRAHILNAGNIATGSGGNNKLDYFYFDQSDLPDVVSDSAWTLVGRFDERADFSPSQTGLKAFQIYGQTYLACFVDEFRPTFILKPVSAI